MDGKHIDWSLYRSFLAVMREGSLSAAARVLGMTQPSIGRHMDALEQALGVTLFIRAQAGLSPTPVATELLEAVETMAAAVQQAARVASGGKEEECGTVRITASQIMGGEVLPALLTQYREQHPQVTIELVLTNKSEDLLKREADIAVRMIRPIQQALLAKRLGRVDIGMYAHQRYVKAHGLPKSLPELRHHTLIGADRDPTIAALAQQIGLPVSRDDFAFRTDSDLAQLAALRAGMGIGGCQMGVARRDPALVPVLPEVMVFSLDMWLVTHSGLKSNKRVMGLFRFLSEALGRYAQSSLRHAATP
ncbi:MAG: LysR family transcriptional regulator [Leptothrix sp. (in: Bacteria)]|nr:LysR family transcriptional regulator [Leptothrix sp. (in: b-proteobacteria)]